MYSPLFLKLPLAGILFAFQESNLAGKVIVALLFAGSIFAWSVMAGKVKELRQARIWTGRFIRAYRESASPLQLYLGRERKNAGPAYEVYRSACSCMASALDVGDAEGSPEEGSAFGAGLDAAQLRSVRGLAERTLTNQVLLMEDNMGLLATATSAAPFLGLLGTVWGVMEAFSGMAVTGSAMLSAVAPGVSGALLTTVVGLLVALPSTIGYNLLSDRIRRLTVETDSFLQELLSDIEARYAERRKR